MKLRQKLFAKVFVILFISFLVSIFYKGIITVPSEGDSVDYHIPIAKSFLDGSIVNPVHISVPKHTKYYPANAEAVLSLFIFSHIPLGLYNVLAITIIFFILVKLGLTFKLNIHMSIIFAVTTCTLNGILRWADTQIIDVWLLSFFLLTIILLENPKKSIKYFMLLGISFGLLIGTKYSAPFIALVLVIVYFKRLLSFFSLRRTIFFLFPLICLGGLWYIRNMLLVGNPLYPQKFLFFPGDKNTILDVSVFKIVTGSFSGFIGTLNAFISEFIVWAFFIPVTIILVFVRRLHSEKNDTPYRLIIISILTLALVINLPSAHQTNIMTSSFRYFLVGVVPLILFVFIYWIRKGEDWIVVTGSLASILLVGFPQGYYPKLILFTLPLSLFIYSKGYDMLVLKLRKWS